MGELVEEEEEEEGDKTERQAVGDHACAAVSVLQRETDSEKGRLEYKNERGGGKWRVARLLPECDLDARPDPRLIHPGSIRLHLTLICITHTYRCTYSCTVTQVRAHNNLQPTQRTNSRRESRHFRGDKEPSITPIKVSRAWLLGLVGISL